MINNKPLLILLLIILPVCVKAKALNGYIITNKFDTISGVVKVPPMNLITGGIFLNTLNFDALHNQVRFKAYKQNKTIFCKPKDILEVGVVHKSKLYVFRSFTVKLNTIVNGDEMYVRRLLRLEYNGNHDLYAERIHQKAEGNELFQIGEYTFNTSYVAPPSQMLGEEIICGNTRFKSLKDYLTFLNFDPLFVTALSDKISYKQLGLVLQKYDKWLLLKHPLASGQIN